MKWVVGRQKDVDYGTHYLVYKMFVSKFFKFDCYLIKMPQGCFVPMHKDPAPDTYTHHRLNITLKGYLYHYFDQKPKVLSRIVYFLASEEIHGGYSYSGCLVLSIGWLKKRTKVFAKKADKVLVTTKETSMRFDGPDYIPQLDQKRLSKQHEVIRDLMGDGKWRTLSEIEQITGYPSPSVSAQLRHLRKPRFGSFIVEKRRKGKETTGLYEYRLLKSR
jgi:hypothetical protein